MPRRRPGHDRRLFQVHGSTDIQPVWWLVTIATAAAMAAAARPRAAPALLVLAGALFGASHVPPTGPMDAACFLVAAGLIKLGGFGHA